MSLVAYSLVFLVYAIIVFVAVTAWWRCVSKGLSKSARGQQFTRYAIGSVLAVLPVAIIPDFRWNSAAIMAAVTGALWAATFPTLTFITKRRRTSDIDNPIDFAAGLYIFSALTAFTAGGCGAGASYLPLILACVVEIAILVVVIAQWGYFAMYGGAIDDTGMQIVADTNVNEVIEFTHAYPWYKTLAAVLVFAVAVAGVIAANSTENFAPVSVWQFIAEMILWLVAVYLLFQKGKGAWYRSGIVKLFNDTRKYRRETARFLDGRAERLDKLNVKENGETIDGPQTILLVIGESASRDYMSAFSDVQEDTTPWMRAMAKDHPDNFVNIRHAYSCAFQTVPALEQALTQKNQYNGRPFADSISIVDMAHKAGYRVTWLSNQGHIGVADTSVSIVAETSDNAEWTLQEVNKVCYDESLLDMLREQVNPADKNFVVLHLKGSHFNFLNRYPASETVWGEPGVQDNLVNYKNSLHYTDSVLKRAFEYCRDNLNLQAMVYCSDHATIPDKYRSPRFDGFGQSRIPLNVFMSESYLRRHPRRGEALQANREKFWTNDLLYELMCGLFDLESPAFDEKASLLSGEYRFTRQDLRTYLGTEPISNDPNP